MPLPEIILQRAELYEQVWTEPMQKLAPKIGISDVGLKKVCVKMGIPTPERGYWAKLEAGHKISRTPLPAFDKNKYCEIYRINPGEKSPALTIPDEFEAELLPIKTITVPENLIKPHPLTLATKQAFKKGFTNDYGITHAGSGPLDIAVSSECFDRALRIMDTIVKGFSSIGIKVENRDNPSGTLVVVKGEEIRFSIVEHSLRSDHVLTEKEKTEQKKYSYFHAQKWDYHPSGILTLSIKEYCDGIQKNWKDGKTKIEDHIYDFFRSVFLCSIEIKNRELKWAEDARRRQEELKRLEDERRLQQEELSRRQGLENQSERWTKSQQIREYVKRMEQKISEPGTPDDVKQRFETWRTWAMAHADRQDPLKGMLPF
jgi:hypothetical protein